MGTKHGRCQKRNTQKYNYRKEKFCEEFLKGENRGWLGKRSNMEIYELFNEPTIDVDCRVKITMVRTFRANG